MYPKMVLGYRLLPPLPRLRFLRSPLVVCFDHLFSFSSIHSYGSSAHVATQPCLLAVQRSTLSMPQVLGLRWELLSSSTMN